MNYKEFDFAPFLQAYALRSRPLIAPQMAALVAAHGAYLGAHYTDTVLVHHRTNYLVDCAEKLRSWAVRLHTKILASLNILPDSIEKWLLPEEDNQKIIFESAAAELIEILECCYRCIQIMYDVRDYKCPEDTVDGTIAIGLLIVAYESAKESFDELAAEYEITTIETCIIDAVNSGSIIRGRNDYDKISTLDRA